MTHADTQIKTLTLKEWRRIDEDKKCIENGQRYVLRIRDGTAYVVPVDVRPAGGVRRSKPARGELSRVRIALRMGLRG